MDPFDTLGIAPAFDLDKNELDRHFRDLSRALHPDRHLDESPAVRRDALSRAVSVNEAYRLLRDDLKRAEALLVRAGATAAKDERAGTDPELLMEMMVLREALSDARAVSDLETVKTLAAKVKADEAHAREAFREALALSTDPSTKAVALQSAQAALGRLRYYRRFRDEVAAIEDEALEKSGG